MPGKDILLWGAIAVVALLLLMRLRRPRREVVATAPRKVIPPDRDSALDDAPPNVLRWQVEMHETARDLKAELDSKMIALQILIRQAREEAERLEQASKTLREKFNDHD